MAYFPPILFDDQNVAQKQKAVAVKAELPILAKGQIVGLRGYHPIKNPARGNGIVPHQAYAVAACILMAEGLPVPPLPEKI